MDMEEEADMGWGTRWLSELVDCVLGRRKRVLGLAHDAHVRIGAFAPAVCVQAERDMRVSGVAGLAERHRQNQGQ